jgi:predicted membrane-bound spermidine synthase
MLLAAVAGAWLVVWWRAGEITTSDGATWLVRSVSALTAVAVVFALDDPSVDTTRALPAARGVLMRLRFGVGAAVVALALAPAALVTRPYLDTGSAAAGVLLEVCVLLVLTASAALVLQRQFGISEPAQFVVFVVVGLAMAAQLLGQRWPLLVPPGPQWAEAHWRWLGVLVVGLLVLAWQLRDPAARPLRRSLRG